MEIENDGMEIVTLDPNKLETKIKFKNPGTVSLSSQNEQDELIIKFDNSLIINDVDGNSLVFDNGEPTEDSVNFNIPVQPQVDKDSSGIQNLEGAAGTMETTGALLTFIQFFMTYMLNSSLGFFFGLINSLQGLCYLPILSVNFPAQVSFYMDFLISIATFDPIPADIFYDIFGVWDF